ncbi:hypothetical protein B0H13DRAFT_2367085 [Mycena leptocephala]|nr:hypothetical protein B0H13DRAFT_2367085 [Mycena leptocephala]
MTTSFCTVYVSSIHEQFAAHLRTPTSILDFLLATPTSTNINVAPQSDCVRTLYLKRPCTNVVPKRRSDANTHLEVAPASSLEWDSLNLEYPPGLEYPLEVSHPRDQIDKTSLNPALPPAPGHTGNTGNAAEVQALPTSLPSIGQTTEAETAVFGRADPADDEWTDEESNHTGTFSLYPDSSWIFSNLVVFQVPIYKYIVLHKWTRLGTTYTRHPARSLRRQIDGRFHDSTSPCSLHTPRDLRLHSAVSVDSTRHDSPSPWRTPHHMTGSAPRLCSTVGCAPAPHRSSLAPNGMSTTGACHPIASGSRTELPTSTSLHRDDSRSPFDAQLRFASATRPDAPDLNAARSTGATHDWPVEHRFTAPVDCGYNGSRTPLRRPRATFPMSSHRGQLPVLGATSTAGPAARDYALASQDEDGGVQEWKGREKGERGGSESSRHTFFSIFLRVFLLFSFRAMSHVVSVSAGGIDGEDSGHMRAHTGQWECGGSG